MPLRHIARRLRVPATAALRRASPPRVSPPPAPRFLASRSSQIQESKRAVNGFKDMDKVDQQFRSDMEELEKAVKNLPKVCALYAGAGACLGFGVLAYAFESLGRNNKYKF